MVGAGGGWSRRVGSGVEMNGKDTEGVTRGWSDFM